MSLSVKAKTFVPKEDDETKIQKKSLHSTLSVDVAEFVPNISQKQDSNVNDEINRASLSIRKQISGKNLKKKEILEEKLQESNQIYLKKQISKKDSRNLNLQHDKKENNILRQTKSFNPRHDVNWAQSENIDKIKESYNARHDTNWYNCVPSKVKHKNLLQKSDSVNWEKCSNHHKEVLQTYSIGVSFNSKRTGTGFKVSTTNDLYLNFVFYYFHPCSSQKQESLTRTFRLFVANTL